jgi:hypothetical protein
MKTGGMVNSNKKVLHLRRLSMENQWQNLAWWKKVVLLKRNNHGN